MLKKKKNIVKGYLISFFEDCTIKSKADLYLDTGKIIAPCISNTVGCLLSESFVSLDGSSTYIICPQCHQYITKVFKICDEDMIEFLECPQCGTI